MYKWLATFVIFIVLALSLQIAAISQLEEAIDVKIEFDWDEDGTAPTEHEMPDVRR